MSYAVSESSSGMIAAIHSYISLSLFSLLHYIINIITIYIIPIHLRIYIKYMSMAFCSGHTDYCYDYYYHYYWRMFVIIANVYVRSVWVYLYTYVYIDISMYLIVCVFVCMSVFEPMPPLFIIYMSCLYIRKRITIAVWMFMIENECSDRGCRVCIIITNLIKLNEKSCRDEFSFSIPECQAIQHKCRKSFSS